MPRNEEMFKTLIDCAKACQMSAEACLSAREVNALVKSIRLNMECAEICVITARLLLKQKDLSHDQVDLCTEICLKCEEECTRKISVSDQCRICAETCRKCAVACRSYQRVNVE